jgi:microtubule-associated protein-like 6
VFNCYDFDGSKELTIDEMTLSMKSTLAGLCKLSGDTCPTENTLELIAIDAFEKADKSGDNKITLQEFLDYCSSNPETKSWLDYYDDPAENTGDEETKLDPDLAAELILPTRNAQHAAAADEDVLFKLEVAEAGDEFMAVKPWVATVDVLEPTNAPELDGSMPSDSLDLEWIHGYRSFDTRNNVRYSSSGSIIYHGAAAGISYTPMDHNQKFNLDHTDDIVSLAMHPDGHIVATGELGRRPKIILWDAATMKTIAVIKGFHQRAVLLLAFSANGKELLSVGGDDDHSVAVYDWFQKKQLFSCKVDKRKVLDAQYSDSGDFTTCGINNIYFWTQNGNGSFTKRKGLFGAKAKPQPLMCLAPSGDMMVSGTASGHLYVWSGRNCINIIKAHNKTVNALYSSPHGIISGGKDMKVRIWSRSMESGAIFDMASFGHLPIVRSACLSSDANKILIGTQGSEIYEISASDGSNINPSSITAGHCQDELWGLAVHPNKPEYCTVGDDMTIRVWDVVTRKMLRMTEIDTPARAVAYSHDGDKLLVGLGADSERGNQKKQGAFIVVNEADLTIVAEARDSRQYIVDVRFSLNGETMAVASSDNNIYLYNTNDFASKGKCKKHTSSITHFDFSVDGDWIQSNCQASELLFFNANTGEHQTSATAMKDIQWASQTCVLGWGVQGIWPPFADGSQMNCADRSNSGKLLAVADDFGQLKLFRYPCVSKGAAFNCSRGHASHATRVCFVTDDTHVISIGGHDKCVFQWRVDKDDEEDDAENLDDEESEEGGLDFQDGETLDRTKEQESANADIDGMFELDFDNGAEQFQVVKPWVSAVVAPSNPPAISPTTPNSNLELEWVHGYRAQDARNNLRYTSSGEIAYCAATIGVILNPDNWTQRYNMTHTDDVICLAVHPEGKYIATGQIGKRPIIVVWDAETGETVQILKGFHQRAVCQLDFSPDGELLASVGQDDDHSLALYRWQDGSIMGTSKGDKNKVLGIQFAPDSQSLVQVGIEHIKFWELGRNMRYKRAVIGQKGVNQAFMCAGYANSGAVVGTADGHLYAFQGRTLDQAIKAHGAAVSALYTYAGGLCSGGKDGKVKLWSSDLEPAAEFDISSLGSCFKPKVRSVCLSSDFSKILVGTRGSEILEISATDGSDVNNGVLLQGHCADMVWGLAVHPTKPQYCTVGDDHTVRVFDASTRKQIRFKELNSMARACAYSPDGSQIAVGLGGRVGRGAGKQDGAFLILNEPDLNMVHQGRDSQQYISEIKYSPDGKTLAVGSHDNNIYLYDVPGNFQKRAMFTKHNSFVSHLDFTRDSQHMQSNDGAYELLFADVTTGSQIPAPSALKNADWSTWTCTLGWPVQGAWPEFADGTELSAVDRSHDGKTLAAADDFGRVKLFRYPSVIKRSADTCYRGHSSHVTKVRWLADDTHLITVGGNDRCVFQWKHEVDNPEDTADEGHEDDSDVDAFGDSMVFALQEADSEKFMAVKPWLGAVVPPTNHPEQDTQAPKMDFTLDYVHGYRAQDARNNLFYNAAGEVVYSSAAVGIIYNGVTHDQKFHIGHDDDIISLAMSTDRQFVATGQLGKRPVVRVWDAATGQEIIALPKFHHKGIPCVAFSPDGKQIASVGQDNDHSVCIYSSKSGAWFDGVKQATEKGDQRKVLFIHFTGDNALPLMTGGVKHINFWKVRGRSLNVQQGLFGKKAKKQPVLCAATIYGGPVITGTVSGHIYVFKGVKVDKVVLAHKSSVNSIYATNRGVVTGSKDGYVKLWDNSLSKLQEYSMNDATPRPYRAMVRSVVWDVHTNKILVGTKGSEIYEISKDSKRTVLLSEGHCADELWGLSTHPLNEDLFATCGDDKTVRVWSISKRKMVKKAVLDTMARAVDWSPDGSSLAVGLGGKVARGAAQKKDGAVSIFCVVPC